MPHKKGRGGQKKSRTREAGDKTYPKRMVRCTAKIAPKCLGWANGNTMPVSGICKRYWQSIKANE